MYVLLAFEISFLIVLCECCAIICPGGGVWLHQPHHVQLLPSHTGQGAGERRAAQRFTGTLHTLPAW